MAKPKILIWDIESTSLKASIGYVICIGYKWYGEDDVYMLSVRDFPSFKRDPTYDLEIIEAFREVYEEADLSVTWNGKRFDIPFLQTRLLEHGKKPLGPVSQFDGVEVGWKKLRLHSNRLQAVQEFFELEDQKTPINFKHWRQAGYGNIKSIEKIEEHCHWDVVVTEDVYERIRPYAGSMHPNMAIWSSDHICPMCQSDNLQARGIRKSITRQYQRWQCNDCGAWSQSVKCEPNKNAVIKPATGRV